MEEDFLLANCILLCLVWIVNVGIMGILLCICYGSFEEWVKGCFAITLLGEAVIESKCFVVDVLCGRA